MTRSDRKFPCQHLNYDLLGQGCASQFFWLLDLLDDLMMGLLSPPPRPPPSTRLQLNLQQKEYTQEKGIQSLWLTFLNHRLAGPQLHESLFWYNHPWGVLIGPSDHCCQGASSYLCPLLLLGHTANSSGPLLLVVTRVPALASAVNPEWFGKALTTRSCITF